MKQQAPLLNSSTTETQRENKRLEEPKEGKQQSATSGKNQSNFCKEKNSRLKIAQD
jgi:hypothetical protein